MIAMIWWWHMGPNRSLCCQLLRHEVMKWDAVLQVHNAVWSSQ